MKIRKHISKTLVALAAVCCAMMAFSGVAEAAITATGFFETIFHANNVTNDVPNPGDWTVTSQPAGDIGRGTLEIAGGNLLDTASFTLMPVGWGSPGTLTVTGSGSKFLDVNGLILGNNNGAGSLIVEDGGWVDLGSASNALLMNPGGPATLLVTGANSKLTATNGKISCGNFAANAPAIMTVEDSGLLQTKQLQFGFDGNSGGYLRMGGGGVLAVEGDKTGGTPFASGGLFNIQGGGSVGEIQYNPSGDGTTWVNITGATEGDDYSLVYYTVEHIVNGQDLNGYTVLTVEPIPEPSDLAFTRIHLDPVSDRLALQWASGDGVLYDLLYSNDPTATFDPTAWSILTNGVSGTESSTEIFLSDFQGQSWVSVAPWWVFRLREQ